MTKSSPSPAFGFEIKGMNSKVPVSINILTLSD